MLNFRIDVTAVGETAFKHTLVLGCLLRRQVVAFRVEDNRKLVLYWAMAEEARALEKPQSPHKAADLIWGWLQQADYPPPPATAKHSEKGWRICNQAWGHVDGQPEAFLAIEPVWAYYTEEPHAQ